MLTSFGKNVLLRFLTFKWKNESVKNTFPVFLLEYKNKSINYVDHLKKLGYNNFGTLIPYNNWFISYAEKDNKSIVFIVDKNFNLIEVDNKNFFDQIEDQNGKLIDLPLFREFKVLNNNLVFTYIKDKKYYIIVSYFPINEIYENQFFVRNLFEINIDFNLQNYYETLKAPNGDNNSIILSYFEKVIFWEAPSSIINGPLNQAYPNQTIYKNELKILEFSISENILKNQYSLNLNINDIAKSNLLALFKNPSNCDYYFSREQNGDLKLVLSHYENLLQEEKIRFILNGKTDVRDPFWFVKNNLVVRSKGSDVVGLYLRFAKEKFVWPQSLKNLFLLFSLYDNNIVVSVNGRQGDYFGVNNNDVVVTDIEWNDVWDAQLRKTLRATTSGSFKWEYNYDIKKIIEDVNDMFRFLSKKYFDEGDNISVAEHFVRDLIKLDGNWWPQYSNEDQGSNPGQNNFYWTDYLGTTFNRRNVWALLRRQYAGPYTVYTDMWKGANIYIEWATVDVNLSPKNGSMVLEKTFGTNSYINITSKVINNDFYKTKIVNNYAMFFGSNKLYTLNKKNGNWEVREKNVAFNEVITYNDFITFFNETGAGVFVNYKNDLIIQNSNNYTHNVNIFDNLLTYIEQNKIFNLILNWENNTYEQYYSIYDNSNNNSKPYFYDSYENKNTSLNIVRIQGKNNNIIKADINVKNYAYSNNSIIFMSDLDLNTMNNIKNNSWSLISQDNNEIIRQKFNIDKNDIEKKQLNFNVKFLFKDLNKNEIIDKQSNNIAYLLTENVTDEERKNVIIDSVEFVFESNRLQFDITAEWVVDENNNIGQYISKRFKLKNPNNRLLRIEFRNKKINLVLNTIEDIDFDLNKSFLLKTFLKFED